MKPAKGLSIIHSKQVRVGFSTGALLTIAKKIIKDHAPKLLQTASILEIVWVSDAQIKKLNKQYRKKNQTTDILSFSYLRNNQTNKDELEPFGQLVISVDTLRKQAEQQNHAYYKEAIILFVHGLLHILGFDHMTEKDFKKMMKTEQRYLGDKSGLVQRSTPE